MSPYLWMMLLSAAVCALLYALLLPAPAGKRAAQAGLSLVLGAALGLAGAKLLYMLLEFDYVKGQGLAEFWRSVEPDMLSFYGGVGGVILAVFLASKLARVPAKTALDAFAVPGALMLAMARFAEFHLGLIGVGNYMDPEESPFCFFPVAVTNEWDEWYLAVFMLEGAVALVIALLAFLRRRSWDLPYTLFWLCLTQIFCESLRAQSITWLFVRWEQLLCFLVAEGIMIAAARKRPKRVRLFRLPPIAGLVLAALVVAEEFALDKTNIPHWITYTLMILEIAAVGTLEAAARRRAGAFMPGGAGKTVSP